MKTSLFEIFKIGIGPSSSHTMGPMRAAAEFARGLREGGVLEKVARVEANLFGSLALTGHGHMTDRAVLLGLSGESPELIAPESIAPKLEAIRSTKSLPLAGIRAIGFDEKRDLLFHKDKTLPFHSNEREVSCPCETAGRAFRRTQSRVSRQAANSSWT